MSFCSYGSTCNSSAPLPGIAKFDPDDMNTGARSEYSLSSLKRFLGKGTGNSSPFHYTKRESNDNQKVLTRASCKTHTFLPKIVCKG